MHRPIPLKYALVIIGVVALLFGAGVAAWFYWANLRGAWTAFGPAPSDITEQLPYGTALPENSTGMPLKIHDGFAISVYAKGLGAPRAITTDIRGRILVSIPSQGKVVALPDDNKDGAADKTVVVISGLRKPHGLTGRCESSGKCSLYIAEENRIAAYDYDDEKMTASNRRVIANLPTGGNHTSRTIAFGPDGRLYVSIGSSCNVCGESDSRRAAIYSMNADGGDFKLFAKGLRNSVFFDWHPATKEMWATDMGRDLLGDDLPPDEINIIMQDGNYGWPICYGKNVHDTVFDKNTYIRNPCMEPFESPSRIDVPAHSAPLGLMFVPRYANWPEEFRGNLLVAYHGSWNRTVPAGYKVVRYLFDEQGNQTGVEDFITGWLTDKGALGRPVDILIMPDGVTYITDDKAGVVYRVVYAKETTSEVPQRSCIPRPACLDAVPRCMLPEPAEGWCPSGSPVPSVRETTTPKTDGCYIGGCSGQLCTDRKDMASTCEWREEYACYRSATCERQPDGQCGWTMTEELRTCVGSSQNNPPAIY